MFGCAMQDVTLGNRNFALKSAETMGGVVGYVRSRDVNDMLSDAEQTLRDNPVPALVGAAVLGFFVGFLLRRY
jgi:ElaB/YqjD/DUF883 family membrane-anchored ribosome-binding protein